MLFPVRRLKRRVKNIMIPAVIIMAQNPVQLRTMKARNAAARRVGMSACLSRKAFTPSSPFPSTTEKAVTRK